MSNSKTQAANVLFNTVERLASFEMLAPVEMHGTYIMEMRDALAGVEACNPKQILAISRALEAAYRAGQVKGELRALSLGK